jgi:tRNA pseudouridine38-40 synthase
VRVTRVEEMPGGFHARFDAKAKHYQYTVDRSAVPNVFLSRFALSHPEPLELRAMECAAELFEGEHDFASYQSQSGQPKDSTVRTIYAVEMREAGSLLSVDVWGSSFLYKMVRTMVGSLLEVGRGRWEPGRIRLSLEAKRRSEAGPTLPGHGLCLIRVYYDISDLQEDLRQTRCPGSELATFSSTLPRLA